MWDHSDVQYNNNNNCNIKQQGKYNCALISVFLAPTKVACLGLAWVLDTIWENFYIAFNFLLFSEIF